MRLGTRALDGAPFSTRSDAETADVGRQFAGSLAAGDLVILSGPLGAGKTVFVRGLAERLGIDPRQVHSPSFTMVCEHASSRGPGLVHVDLYRVGHPAEVEELGLGDYLAGDWIVAVEWGEKLPARMREGAALVALEDAGGRTRRLTLRRPARYVDQSSP
ncbi:MAG TPA: tRNA (adenosine(37)-N6)-threonylcarbamoyltransferase complex ATPase subunit type 1 TsaE [Candidatus Polarisedimenticolia bacterium]|nr:tRNA (adenosine(37)-N6)-threonylcarbamoyltransferase complex ATPase subunit type 1 TsaE [Candidatus Polarisedimenticolia bacterium]